MKKLLFIISFILLYTNVHSQIHFEKGYFINNHNQKTTCLIKNKDWKSNPTKFQYKINENSEIKTADLNTVKEFSIDDVSKFKRFKVKLDRSNDHHDYSDQKSPEFNEETLFLRVLLEGTKSLYLYEAGNIRRFFYSDDTGVYPLVYKKYLIKNKYISENLEFKQQLIKHFQCKDFNSSDYKNVDYNKKDLINFFKNYNLCNNNKVTIIEKKNKKIDFNLTFRPGISLSSLSINNKYSNPSSIDFDNEISFRFGAELELVFPFNKRKWSVFIEPTYQYYKTEKDIYSKSNIWLSSVDVDYKSLALPLGVRHYFFLNNNSKLFLNAFAIYYFNNDSKIDFNYSDNVTEKKLDISSDLTFGFGAGYKFKDKYSIEVQYHLPSKFLRNYQFWDSDYKTFSLIFGYTLF